MKVLVTGATGFVGHRLLLLLREKGHEPVVLSRDVDQAWVRLPLHCSVISWNPLAGDPPLKAFEGIEAVVHLAGESVAEGRWTPPRKDKIRRSRIESTRRLVHAMRQASPRPAVFLCASAIGYYGMDPRAEFTETSPSGEGFLAEVCREWEKEAFGAAEAGVRTVVLRIGLVLGDHGGAMARILPPFRAGLGGPLGNGTQWMSWIHRDDLAGLIVHALEHPTVEGGVNAVAPQPVTNAEFTRCLARELRKPAFLPAPASVLRLALGEMSDLLLGSQKVSGQKAVEGGYAFRYPDLESALREVCSHENHLLLTEQWVPRPLDSVFAFFSDARNLEILTPAFLHFKITGVSTESLQKGTVLDYRLSLHGFPVYWQSTITEFEKGRFFTDVQTRGPYAYWRHTHDFFEKEGGTVIRDRAIYRVPFGVPGDVVAHPFVRQDLERIFSYRRKKIIELMGQ